MTKRHDNLFVYDDDDDDDDDDDGPTGVGLGRGLDFAGLDYNTRVISADRE